VSLGAAANNAEKLKATPEIGDKMPAGHSDAGWIYAGVSKTTHQPLYVAPRDSGVFQWRAAMDFAAKEGARVPSKDELDQIYDAMDKGSLKGTFNLAFRDFYWSSSQRKYDFPSEDFAFAQCLRDGRQTICVERNVMSLRCVR
jgi:hypothetical protein